MTKIDSLILNSPYKSPAAHWEFVEEGAPLARTRGRRAAGYMIADPKAKPYQDKGRFVPLPLVNQIRQRVDKWRAAGYPSITGITRTLLAHWQDDEQREFPFFFCQVEAIETLIWLIETPDAEKNGLDIGADGGVFARLCCKLATGSGKTVVMAMLIAWQAINRATYPRDGRFARHVFIVAPNLTVRERLAVLQPAVEKNYYDEFGIAPRSLRDKLHQAKVLIRNWHVLNWESQQKLKPKAKVDKRGAKSDAAYAREVLGELASARNLIVINDEAHHAWRVPAESKIKGVKKEEIEEATKWIGGLDRLHKTNGILNCFDFSATPFVPSGKKASEHALFDWIVSDFGLDDAIEAGLVKTPRTVVRDDSLPDAKTYQSRLYHLYNDPEVKDDLNRRAKEHESLPDLVTNAYALLGADWKFTKQQWNNHAAETPPVMISIANRTETAARIKYAFDHHHIPVASLCEAEGILHIDSQVLKKAEQQELESPARVTAAHAQDSESETRAHKITKQAQSAMLRGKVNTVGQPGQPGAAVQNVISVGMLSEGWDARTVTHIMGLRAFTSQLLCEQVVGRGLRRASYEINEKTGLFDAEYVNVFGVPFNFLPHEQGPDDPPPPPPKMVVKPVEEKKEFAIQWPNVIRIDRTYTPQLTLDWQQVTRLKLDAASTVQIAELAPTVSGKRDVSKIRDIDLAKLMKFRQQTMIFKTAQSVWQDMKPKWQGSEAQLIAELVRLAEQFIHSDRLEITPTLFDQDKKKKKLVITLSMAKVINHFWHAIQAANTEKLDPVFDNNHPICETGGMRVWRTGKPCRTTTKSHINRCVFDGTWEAYEASELDKNKAVAAWVKNDHLNFEVLYVYQGVVQKYRPDFIARLASGEYLVLEVKGRQSRRSDAKHAYMKEWVEAVNQHGDFGRWRFAVSKAPSEVKDILVA